jgi:uncharacterized protein
MPNYLIKEKSPYLQQHAHNPVHWYPWGEEALQQAVQRDCPIMVSVGYSTCHWCHVMERESFENEQVAQRMNDSVVAIKIDREERPDLDQYFMKACHSMGVRGGWPLNVLLTPEGKPFYVFTYLPAFSSNGRSGLYELMQRVQEVWQADRQQIMESSQAVHNSVISPPTAVQSFNEQSHESFRGLSIDTIQQGFSDFSEHFDSYFGGFGGSPKFPSPHNMIFLLQYYGQHCNERALELAEVTLQKMRMGGICDQVGFGFHRYSTDRQWLVPHFEKMLYDQAMHILAYAQAYAATGNVSYKGVVLEITQYLQRDMQHEQGGFYTAEDADSEGEEGLFYTWTTQELQSVLSGDQWQWVQECFSIAPEGNYLEEATQELTGRNILVPKATLPSAEWASVRTILLRERSKKIRPLRDEKILTDLNGLMIAALAKAGFLCGEQSLVQSAMKASAFLEHELMVQDSLYHRWCDGETAVPALGEDYVFWCWGLLELYESTGLTVYKQKALDLFTTACGLFCQEPHLGPFAMSPRNSSWQIPVFECYDGAVPSLNSVALDVLLRLFQITLNTNYLKHFDSIVHFFKDQVQKTPMAHSHFLQAVARRLPINAGPMCGPNGCG